MSLKLFGVLFSSLMLFCCSKQPVKGHLTIQQEKYEYIDIPNIQVDKAQLEYDNKTSIWKLNNDLFSGYLVDFYSDSLIKEKTGIVDGRKENKSLLYFKNGVIKQESYFHKGKLHGEKKIWSSDTSHIIKASLNYYQGKAHGLQKKWYSSGEIYKILNLNMGREEGLQRAFRKNGDLYANYEAKEGRIFGLKKAALCYGLDDEIIQYEN